jgi:paraquat-inducible protein A
LVSVVACPDCDLLQRLPFLAPGATARCRRCQSALERRPAAPTDLALALAVTAVIAYILANTLPLMSLSVVGRAAATTIVGGAYAMWDQGERLTGLVVLFCGVIAPAGYILFMLTLLLAVRRAPPPAWAGEMLRGVRRFEVWSMLEVMMLGILVSLIKIAELATVDAGMGMYAFGALVILCPAIMLSFDEQQLWQKVQWADGERPSAVQVARLRPTR